MPEITVNPIETPWANGATSAPVQTATQTAPTSSQAASSPDGGGLLSQFDASDLLSSDNVLDYGKKALNYFNPSSSTALGSFASGGAATGALTAGGGTFVTGSGLAGTASAINTTAGAAGTAGSAAGAGLGVAFGVAGIIASKVIGGLLGGLFGSKPKKSWLVINSGTSIRGSDWGWKGSNNTYDLALGKIQIAGKEQGDALNDPVYQMFKQSDEVISQLFSAGQLERVKEGIATGAGHSPYKGRKLIGSGIVGGINAATTSRYANAAAGLDEYWGGTVNRSLLLPTYDDGKIVRNEGNLPGGGYKTKAGSVGESNLMSLMNTISYIDRDITNQTGAFAGSGVDNAEQGMDFLADKFGIGARPPPPPALNRSEATKKAFVTDYRNKARVAANKSRQDELMSMVRGGNTYGNSRSLMPTAYAGASGASEWSALPAKREASESGATRAWEKKVLDAYVSDYEAQPANQTRVTRTDAQPASQEPQADSQETSSTQTTEGTQTTTQTVSSGNRRDLWQGGVNLNPASPLSSTDATNAQTLKRGMF